MTTDRYVGSRLFLSCDLVGSTGFKQRNREAWVPYFLEFYNDFPSIVSSEIAQRQPPNIDASELTLWKPVGDELIFTYEVSSASQVRELVRVWVAAMGQYNATNQARLTTKGSAFLATFPLPDREVAIPGRTATEVTDDDAEAASERAVVNRSEGFVFDYIGPSIDTGFRIAELSDERFFTMSLEVAWAFAHTEHARGLRTTDDFMLLGTHELKGVRQGHDYPVLAIDRLIGAGDVIAPAINKLAGTAPAEHRDVLELAEACHSEALWPCRICLPDTMGYKPFSAHERALHDKAAELNELANQQMNSAELRNERGMRALDSDAPLE